MYGGGSVPFGGQNSILEVTDDGEIGNSQSNSFLQDLLQANKLLKCSVFPCIPHNSICSRLACNKMMIALWPVVLCRNP